MKTTKGFSYNKYVNKTSVGVGEVVFQTILAFVALFFGYPNMGNIAIIIMAPFVFFMVLRMNALLLPALMIHCSSYTSIMYAVFFSMMIVCIINTKAFNADKSVRFVYRMLLFVLPFFIALTIQRMALDLNTWQEALGYVCYYLGFWAFLYCFLISDTFNALALKLLIGSIVLLYLFFAVLSIGQSGYLLTCFMYIALVYGIWFILKSKHKMIGVGLLVFSVPVFLLSIFGTFTFLLTAVYAIIVFWLWARQKKLSATITGWASFIVILILMGYGILNINSAHYGNYADHMDFSSVDAFLNRAKFKFFGDRVPYWYAGLEQLIALKPILPMHDIPDIIPADRIEEVTFGAHNTPLQLMRIFGILAGGLLILCYVVMTNSASKYFRNFNWQSLEVPIIAIAITNSIVLFMTGTAAMLPAFALFSFGLMGIAVGKNCRLCGLYKHVRIF